MRAIATFGYIGLLPGPVGTWASLAALGSGYLLHLAGGFPLFAAAIVLGCLLGIRAVEGETTRREVVIDEVLGQWLALMPLSAGLWHAGAPPHLFPWPGWVSAFLLFRLLDIWKPGPVGWAARRPGPAGVLLDDLVAGLIAAAIVTLMAAIAHGWLA